MQSILEVSGLNKRFAAFSLENVTFEMPTGFIMGFIGPNGAGKTTTIKTILNMINYQSGEIKIFGIDSKDNGDRIYEQIGVVMDTPFYADEWTAADVEAAVSPYYQHWNGEKYVCLLRQFAIDHKKKVKELSRGMKVKLMIAVALSHDAKLLILDEPTSGLDPVARDELCEMLSEFVTDENRSVLFSTHITADLEKIADYITFILNGRIIFTGPKEDLLENYVMVKGGLNEIDAQMKNLLIGLREHGTGFEGMIETANLNKLPGSLLAEPVTLDEIIIHMNRGAKTHA
ncbi:MAG: ABC transporter ATP-binding protein [Bacillota bacterium]|nr:ABC transporter ATP-binding protein [Bacillota bacterium]